MNKVKADFWLRKELSICRWAKYEGYFPGLSAGRQINFFSSAVAWPNLAKMISPLFNKIIILGQVANLLPFYRQNYIYGCKVAAIRDGHHSYFCLEMGTECTSTLVHVVERNFHFYDVFYRNAFKISTSYEKNSSKTV